MTILDELTTRLQRQIAITEALRTDLHLLAAKPCLQCDIITPELIAKLQARIKQLEAQVDKLTSTA